MSEQVNFNYRQLKEFAKNLNNFNKSLEEDSRKINNQVKSLVDPFRDPNPKFAAEFERNMKNIQTFLKTSEKYYVYFLRMVEAGNLVVSQKS
jgi:hypothetical protein